MAASKNNTTKRRWQEAELISKRLADSFTKNEVYFCYSAVGPELWARMLEDGYDYGHLPYKLAADEVTRKIEEAVQAHPIRRGAKAPLQVFDEEAERPQSVAQELGMAMWFLRKIGDVDRAVELVKVAAVAVKKFQP